MKARFQQMPERYGDRYTGRIQFSDGMIGNFNWYPADDRVRFSARINNHKRAPVYQKVALTLLREYTSHWAQLDHPNQV